MNPIDLYNLKIGDIFMEGSYPELYEVIGKSSDEFGYESIHAKDLKEGSVTLFGYDRNYSAEAPQIIYVTHY